MGEARGGRPVVAAAAAVLPVTLMIATIPLVPTGEIGRHLAMLTAVIVPYAVVGAVLLSRGAGGPLGALFVAVGGLVAVAEAASRYAGWGRLQASPGWREAAWLADLLWFVPLLLLGIYLLLLFPTGRPPSPRWRWVGRVGGAGLALVLVPLAIGTWDVRGSSFVPSEAAPVPLLAAVPALLGALACLAALIGAVAAVVDRFRRADGIERLQLRWFVVASVLTTAGTTALFVLPIGGWVAVVLTFPLVPFATGVAVLRYRLYALPRLLTQLGAFTLMVVIVLTVQGAVVTLLGPSVTALAVAGFLVAFVVGTPMARRTVEGVARRLVPGNADPRLAVVQLGWQLEAVSDPREVVAGSVRWLTEVLPITIATVVLSDGEKVATSSPAGAAQGPPVRSARVLVVPLVLGGRQTGVLQLTSDPREEVLTGRDRRLLGELAPHLAAATHAIGLQRDLERAHQQLVTSREEERRRIRRDLHDQLGPTLAAIALGLEALDGSVPEDDPVIGELLVPLREAAADAVDDVRRIVDDLRPPALDELGLQGAIRQAAQQLLERGGAQVTYGFPEDLPTLPAAVEVAILRIATEALANIARHAGAARCRLTMRVDDTVELEVVDDGRGLSNGIEGAEGSAFDAACSSATRSGTGLRSMRDRATELGGSFEVTPYEPRGTRVVARLPATVP
jgi:two-component system, NarL family, sensor kinase